MKKYIIGGLVGFMLATAAGANAQGVTKLIDQVVQGVFPVTVDGTSIGDAVVIDNKTYLPVREFGEAVGYKVTFSDAQEVVLTKNTDATTPSVPVTPQPPTITPQKSNSQIQAEIDTINDRIKWVKKSVEASEYDIKGNSSLKDQLQIRIDGYNKQISDYEAQVTALEKQKQ